MNELTTTHRAGVPALSEYAMTIADVQNQVQLIQQVMKAVMKNGEHYGTVPGCGDKKALLKSGAEKLSVTFRLAPEYVINKTELVGGHREYEVVCKMVHIPTGAVVGQGVGSCSTMESKYRWRNASDYEVLDEAIPKDAREKKAEYRKMGLGMKQVDGAWVWVRYKSEGKVENPDIADTYNTVLKMAKKRAHVDATLTCTGASDIFEQDLDEFSEEELERVREGRGNEQGMKPKTEAPKAKATKKTLTDYVAELNAIDTVDGLSRWWEANTKQCQKELSKADQGKLVTSFTKRKGEIEGAVDMVACPNREGSNVPTSYCDGDCASREGCPAHA